MILEKFMTMDPNKKGLTNDQYLEKYISKGKEPSKEAIEKFIKERKIPKQHLNAQLKQRIKQFLSEQIKKDAVDSWLASKTKKDPVEVYIHQPKRPVFNAQVGDAPWAGGANAKVTIVEFSDYQCPFCSKAALTMKKLKKKYGKKIKVAFKNYPLPFHKDAKKASEYGLCANEQNPKLFWKMYDTMFANQQKLSEDDLKKYAQKHGVDMKKLKSCLDSGKAAKQIEKEMSEGEKLGIKSTPTFFVNGQLISGALPIENFEKIINQELKK